MLDCISDSEESTSLLKVPERKRKILFLMIHVHFYLFLLVPGEPLDRNGDLAGETINYNEQFWWANPWAQGRIGFGRFAGRLNQEFRAAQFRGMPYPILWVAEYFTLDGEQIRWGRKFRQAGWYTHQFLW